MLGGMLLVSVVASALAYFSIQVGSVSLFGSTTIWEAGESFLIAAAQIAMPLWLGHVIDQNERTDEIAQVLPLARHWLAVFACFTGAASLTNFHAFKRRQRQKLADSPVLASYETMQRKDRWGALGTTVVVGGAWCATLLWVTSWMAIVVIVLVYVVLVVLAFVLLQQSKTLQQLSADVALVPGED